MPKLIRCIQPHIGKTVDTSVYVGEVLEISGIELNNGQVRYLDIFFNQTFLPFPLYSLLSLPFIF